MAVRFVSHQGQMYATLPDGRWFRFQETLVGQGEWDEMPRLGKEVLVTGGAASTYISPFTVWPWPTRAKEPAPVADAPEKVGVWRGDGAWWCACVERGVHRRHVPSCSKCRSVRPEVPRAD